MPTPQGQSPIPAPWFGSGNIGEFYGIDIRNDRRAADGWELMFNSFNPNASGPLINPYFVLYNKYRGLMRIFIYLNSGGSFAPSTYLMDRVWIDSSQPTSLLNFLGKEIIDTGITPTKSYSQIQPMPEGSRPPLSMNRWYMLQYELAYDPNLINIPHHLIELQFSFSSYNITKVSLGGEITGTIHGTIGTQSSNTSDMFSRLRETGKEAGTGVLAGVGLNVLKNNVLNESTGENKLKIPNHIFKALYTGVNSALSKATGNLPGAVVNLLSGIFGGSSAEPTVANFNLNANITLEGTMTDAYAIPGSPKNFWIPTTNGLTSAAPPERIPLYNKSLGVVNFIKPTDKLLMYITEDGPYHTEDPQFGTPAEMSSMTLHFPQNIDYSQYLIINPEVEKIADVMIKSQDLYVKYGKISWYSGYVASVFNPTHIGWEHWYSGNGPSNPPHIYELGVRFEIEVKPKSGAPASTIYKTFAIN
jgi:hypothetical protein